MRRCRTEGRTRYGALYYQTLPSDKRPPPPDAQTVRSACTNDSPCPIGPASCEPLPLLSFPSISGLVKLTVISRLRYWNRILHRLGISKIHRCWIREGEAWEERRFRAGLVIFRPSQRFPLLKIYEGRARRERAKQTVSIRKLFTITSSHRLSSSPQQRCPCAETTLKRVLYSRGIILGETVELELQFLFFLGKRKEDCLGEREN